MLSCDRVCFRDLVVLCAASYLSWYREKPGMMLLSSSRKLLSQLEKSGAMCRVWSSGYSRDLVRISAVLSLEDTPPILMRLST